MTLLELADRVEAATGPDRELDAEIAVTALGFFVADPRYPGAPTAYGYVDEDGSRVEPGHGGKQLIRQFTSSLDAAMTLVPVGWSVLLFVASKHHSTRCTLAGNGETIEASESIVVVAATPALALTSASLRAMALDGGIE
jgi:hypothetical protein